ncbi:hypothetical protein PACTADRAFT_2230 [Pachysolen tannophilus NRRL Y-2460]|uniref:Dihydrofolate reductase n=1 Tax=Pachysolen tannophilus NRRL Y-2460 TaxID=669874 RepID=A0A1E4TW17_PACTA|nr:hypothetical protein PACTADRAFT_2230 [Pachysolen tannophilus NRRL Y-2460]
MTSAPKPPVSIVVAALLPSFGIGQKGRLPWKLKQEMKYFKQVTSVTSSSDKKNVVIMGRKTWESIPVKFRPLPDRINVILTRNKQALTETLKDELLKHNINSNERKILISDSLTNGIKEVTDLYNDKIERIFIIGGGELYNSVLEKNLVDQILLTEVYCKDKDQIIEMDTFLNSFSKAKEDKIGSNSFQWEKSSIENYLNERNIKGFNVNNEENGFEYTFTLYNKNL